jgi:hypothetical protein
LTFVTVETTDCTVLGALDTTFWAVEVIDCTGDPGDPAPGSAGWEEEPELAGWVDAAVVDELLVADEVLVADEDPERAGDDPEPDCDVDRGGVFEGGELGAGVEELGVAVEVVGPGFATLVVGRVVVVAPAAAPAARGEAPARAGW